jgi:hypothetical protein
MDSGLNRNKNNRRGKRTFNNRKKNQQNNRIRNRRRWNTNRRIKTNKGGFKNETRKINRYKYPFETKKWFGVVKQQSRGIPGISMKGKVPVIYNYDKNIAGLGKGSYKDNYNYFVDKLNKKQDIEVGDVKLVYKNNFGLPIIKESNRNQLDKLQLFYMSLFVPSWLRAIFYMITNDTDYKTFKMSSGLKDILNKIITGEVNVIDKVPIEEEEVIKNNIETFKGALIELVKFESSEGIESKVDQFMKIKNTFTMADRFSQLLVELPEEIQKVQVKFNPPKEEVNRYIVLKSRYWNFLAPLLVEYDIRELLLMFILGMQGKLLFYSNIGTKNKKNIVFDPYILAIRSFYNIKKGTDVTILTPTITDKEVTTYQTLF